MSVRLWSLLVWALVGASAVFWALQLWARPQGLPPQAALAQPPDLLQTSLARLAGGEGSGDAPAGTAAAPAAAPADGRFVLVGVVSAPTEAASVPASAPAAVAPAPAPAVGAARDGVALIAIDGKPPRTFAVGAVVDGDWILQAVSRRAAQLGPPGQPAQVQLAIPAPPPPARGTPAAATAPT